MGANQEPDFPGIQRKGVDPVPSKDQAEDRPEPTHDLLLADGSVVEHSGGIPTHYGKDGGPAIRVLSATERQ